MCAVLLVQDHVIFRLTITPVLYRVQVLVRGGIQFVKCEPMSVNLSIFEGTIFPGII